MRTSRLVLFTLSLILVIAVVGALVAFFVFRSDSTLDIGAVNRVADQRILFIGNSFTHYHELYKMVDVMLEESNEDWTDVLTGQQAPPGANFSDHLTEIENVDDNPALRQALVTGNDTLRAWDAVVLQEQSQLLGFGPNDSITQSSFAAARDIHAYITDTGAMTLLYMTWGYRDGDATNPDVYPNFPTMQQHITTGYDTLATILQQQGGRVYVIPVGQAFQVVYDDEIRAGRDPLAETSRFVALYEDDGSHPSPEGSYLAACVFVVAYSGFPASNLTYWPNEITEENARYLQGVADRVVLQNMFGDRVYPFEE